MGVPKFFRWISERYPTISQLIAENRIPEFDNLYLDMNGIIHNCTHGDSDSPARRIPPEQVFIAIFNYIEHLYGKIKPKKLFFMAIDGVAPRAKMNQQRARRFRTALEAEKAYEKAVKDGVPMPEGDAFDSNCITPGTEFMAQLTRQLKYFIHRKVSQDADWQGVDIILSGHEVPGEGEHKIMEYIRLAKAQPDYDPNIRHCLYGLDADLIMLGLSSHDPHFCLLREEVTFGRQPKTKSKELEHQNFYLMHLSVVREYLEHEFQDLKAPGVLSFPFEVERIIDDFILLAFFVGNDFLPSLPGLHINEGALELQFRTYKSVLPKAEGYINDHGVINLERLKLLLDELSEFEQRNFEHEVEDANWLKGKQKGNNDAMEKLRKRNRLVLSSEQMAMFKKVKKWLGEGRKRPKDASPVFDVPVNYSAKDRKFVEELAANLRLKCERAQNTNREFHLQLSRHPPEGESEDSDEDTEGRIALLRIFRIYEKAQVVDITGDDVAAEAKRRYEERFVKWKEDYYKDKFHWGLENEEGLRELAENYVEGLQWVLHYYYRGVVSWPWFYRHHYAPRISDVSRGLGAKLEFELGQPFRPFEQLMGVLPDRSKKIVPEPYHELMTSLNSPIIDFYPRDFELDMNGKKMDWEAVVKIPFIDEKRLLKAMRTKEAFLTKAERERNTFGTTLKFTHNPDLDETYKSSVPGIFPDIAHCKCLMNTYELPTLEGGLEIIVGLCEGAKLGINALAGFPSLNTLNHTAQLGFHGVTVFQQESRGESMVITLENAYRGGKAEEAKKLLGHRVFVGYPFLQEAKVVEVSDEMFRYTPLEGHVIQVPHGPSELSNWKRKADRIENHYSRHMGMVIGPVEVMVRVDMLKGMRRTDDGAMIKEYDRIPGVEVEYAAQTIVQTVASEDQRFVERPAVPIEEEFPEGCHCFFLGDFNYGRPLEVIRHCDYRADVWIGTNTSREPENLKQIVQQVEQMTPYIPSYHVARQIGLNTLVLSKITSSFSVLMGDKRLNLGLNLKFEAKKLKVLGYSRRTQAGWEFSRKAIDLIQEYMAKFPQFFQGIQRNPNGDLYKDTDFFTPEESHAKIKAILDWLKSIESKGFEKVPLEAEQLDSDVVKRIEEAVDAHPRGELTFKRVNKVPRKAMLKPEDAEHRLSNQHFSLGDRVVYVASSGKVPIASRGTIVGLTRTSRVTLLDIVFDDTFMSGTTLNSRCSPFRGMTVPVSAVLNLTNRQLVAATKAAESQQAALNSQQLRPAPPPPQLTGSYANAAATGPQARHSSPQPLRGGRGRSGRGSPAAVTPPRTNSPRGGFVPRGPIRIAQRGGPPSRPAAQNGVSTPPYPQPNVYFTPDQYHHVPPPAILNHRGRGSRGRGGGRGGY